MAGFWLEAAVAAGTCIGFVLGWLGRSAADEADSRVMVAVAELLVCGSRR